MKTVLPSQARTTTRHLRCRDLALTALLLPASRDFARIAPQLHRVREQKKAKAR